MKSSTKHPKEIASWLSQINSHIAGLESGIRLIPQIYKYPERYVEYSDFVNFYEKWLDLNQESNLLLTNEYSIKALQLMAKLSNTELHFQAWYELYDP